MGGFSANLGVGFAFEAELVAALLGIEVAYQKGWTKLWIESDSMYVVFMLNSLTPKVPWKCLEKWRFIKSYLSQIQWFASHTYREANVCADALASYNSDEVFIWWDSKPAFLDIHLYNDLNISFTRV